MKTCFASELVITQVFGNDFMHNNKLYYAQYGIKGHNGLDVIPKDKKDLRIFNFFEGKILKIEKHATYGNRICIWNKSTKLAEYHNHLQSFNPVLKVGQHVKSGTLLGFMGNTGKSFGPHDHIGFVETDEKGYRVNKDNGYLGWIDPLPLLI